MTAHDLPAVNASLNGLSALLLLLGRWFIRQGNRRAHRAAMLGALGTSTLFLVSYLTYHLSVQAVTHFREPAWFRPIYLALLTSHTLLAAAILPLVLVTIARAFRGDFDRHKAIARWTWPVWMYVSVTGVLIYLLLYRIFPQSP